MTQPQNGKVWRWRMEVSTPEGAVVILDVGDVKPRAAASRPPVTMRRWRPLGCLSASKPRWTAASRGLDRPAVDASHSVAPSNAAESPSAAPPGKPLR